MLNALRHLRFGQRGKSRRLFLGKYVLNALRHLRFGQISLTAIKRAKARAQRLAASKVWAALNLDTQISERDPVLNALRHLRFGQALSSPLLDIQCHPCSTPCGI